MFSWFDNIYEIIYGDHILKSVIATDYAKEKLCTILMMLSTIILRVHITSLLCYLISWNIYIDFFVHIIMNCVKPFS